MGSSSVQSQLWGRHPRIWSQDLEPMLAPLYRATLDALAPLAGRRLLDVGCGSGLVLQLAAAEGAQVSGLDATAALLAVAGTRVPAADLREGDLEELPYDDAAFDVVCAFNSIQYADDPVGAVAEMARVCRVGGRVALGMWGDPARCETDALFARLRSLAPAAPGAAAPLLLSHEGVVEELFEAAGLEVDGGGEVACPFEFADLDQAWTVHQAGGPMQKAIDLVGAGAVRQLLEDVLETDRKPDGALRQDNVFRYLTATAR
jgi:SAM-dependent methyltransferase